MNSCMKLVKNSFLFPLNNISKRKSQVNSILYLRFPTIVQSQVVIPSHNVHTNNYKSHYKYQWTNKLISSLTEKERTELLQKLTALQQTSKISISPDTPAANESLLTPTPQQLRALALAHGLPFIGFGFLDNAIMIVAGEYIEIFFGSIFPISTMAAAALGNLVSDVMGMGLVGYVEALFIYFGVEAPPLTPEQMRLRSAYWASLVGRLLGITTGCLIGMFPLLLFKRSSSSSDNDHQEQEKQS